MFLGGILSSLLSIRHDAHLTADNSEVCQPVLHPCFHQNLPGHPGLAARLRLSTFQRLHSTRHDTSQVLPTDYFRFILKSYHFLNISSSLPPASSAAELLRGNSTWGFRATEAAAVRRKTGTETWSGYKVNFLLFSKAAEMGCWTCYGINANQIYYEHFYNSFKESTIN